MKSKSRFEGYLMVDHRASPGIPEDVARAAGRDPRFSGEGKLFEAATMTCWHCQNIVVLNPERRRARAYCPKCDNYICDGCEALRQMPGYVHVSMEQLSDAILESAAKGAPLGSSLELLNQPKIFVP